MAHRSTVEAAEALLDRYFREAEGRTDLRLDVAFIAADLDLRLERLEAATDYLLGRGLVRLEGPDAAYLTDLAVQTVRADRSIAELPLVRSFSSSPGRPSSAPGGAGAHPPASLTLVTPDGAATRIPLGTECTLGRAPDNTIVIDDKRASKHHARVRADGPGFVLEDLDSANGTLLNSAYCTRPTKLCHEDEIVIGRTMVIYQGPSSVPSSSPRAAPSSSPRVVTESARPTASTPPSGLRVVRGTPDEPASPSHLFERPAESSPLGAVFEAEELADLDGTPALEAETPTPALAPTERPSSSSAASHIEGRPGSGAPSSSAAARPDPDMDTVNLAEGMSLPPFPSAPDAIPPFVPTSGVGPAVDPDLETTPTDGIEAEPDFDIDPDPDITLMSEPALGFEREAEPAPGREREAEPILDLEREAGPVHDLEREPEAVHDTGPEAEPVPELAPEAVHDIGPEAEPVLELAPEPVHDIGLEAEPVLELAPADELPESEAPPPPGASTLVASEASTVTLGLELDTVDAEALPEASPSLAEFEHPAEVAPPPPLLRTLERLEDEVRRVTGEGPHPLLAAIRTVRSHPLVRAFAEDGLE